MRFGSFEAKDKTGQTIVLRNAETSDAEDLIKYLKITTEETPFLTDVFNDEGIWIRYLIAYFQSESQYMIM